MTSIKLIDQKIKNKNLLILLGKTIDDYYKKLLHEELTVKTQCVPDQKTYDEFCNGGIGSVIFKYYPGFCDICSCYKLVAPVSRNDLSSFEVIKKIEKEYTKICVFCMEDIYDLSMNIPIDNKHLSIFI